MHDSARSKTTVYAAIELSKKSWVVAIARPDRDRPGIQRIAGGNLAELIALAYVPLAVVFTPSAWVPFGPFGFQLSRPLHYAT